MSKRTTKPNPHNMESKAPSILAAINELQISKMYLAEKLYAHEWDKDKQDVKQTLTMRLRNRLNGTGRLEEKELEMIQNILLEMADALRESVRKAVLHKERKQKIAKLLENPDMVDPNQLDSLLNRIE